MFSSHVIANKETGKGTTWFKSCIKPSNQTTYDAVLDILLYSASADDLLTVLCFLVFQQTKWEPKKMQ